ncbi:Hypoxanthine/guanine phosphoribosyltransferase [uncultured archaeon]|nr:Hypoxanthine/guanine phosphoribosyltransferase [uncultured archaeon]
MVDIEKQLKERIRDVPNYPKKGIMFRDITPLLKDAPLFAMCVDELARRFEDEEVDYVVGVEARGFIIGSALAYALGVGFVPIRKKGKLPYRKVSKDYDLEYGKETIEIHSDAVEKGSRVLLADDLLATGGTAEAAAGLLRDLGASIVGFAFIVELKELRGAEKLGKDKVVSLVKY